MINRNSSAKNSFKDESVLKEVQNDLEFKIITGELAPGEKFPPIRDLAEMYDIGTSTAQKIVNNLSSEDIIVKKRGVGFFIKPYVKGKLIDKHTAECRRMFRIAIDYAVELGLDSKAIVEELLEVEKK